MSRARLLVAQLMRVPLSKKPVPQFLQTKGSETLSEAGENDSLYRDQDVRSSPGPLENDLRVL